MVRHIRYKGQMKFLGWNIVEEEIPVFRRELELLRIRMREVNKSQAIHSSNGGNSMTSDRNLVISEKREGKAGFIMDLKAISPHAAMQEFGITEMWVDANKYKSLEAWAEAIGYQFSYGRNGAKWVHIGGPNSRIQLGNSKNQFFFNTVDNYLTSKRLEQQAEKAISKAIDKTMR